MSYTCSERLVRFAWFPCREFYHDSNGLKLYGKWLWYKKYIVEIQYRHGPEPHIPAYQTMISRVNYVDGILKLLQN